MRLQVGGKYTRVLIPISVDTDARKFVRYVPKVPFMSVADIQESKKLDLEKLKSAALMDTPAVHETLNGDFYESSYVSIMILDGNTPIFRQE